MIYLQPVAVHRVYVSLRWRDASSIVLSRLPKKSYRKKQIERKFLCGKLRNKENPSQVKKLSLS